MPVIQPGVCQQAGSGRNCRMARIRTGKIDPYRRTRGVRRHAIQRGIGGLRPSCGIYNAAAIGPPRDASEIQTLVSDLPLMFWLQAGAEHDDVHIAVRCARTAGGIGKRFPIRGEGRSVIDAGAVGGQFALLAGIGRDEIDVGDAGGVAVRRGDPSPVARPRHLRQRFLIDSADGR